MVLPRSTARVRRSSHPPAALPCLGPAPPPERPPALPPTQMKLSTWGVDTFGTTDVSQRLLAVDASMGSIIFMEPGRYRLEKSITLRKPIYAQQGAVFELQAGVTLTLLGAVSHPATPFFVGPGSVSMPYGLNPVVPVEWMGGWLGRGWAGGLRVGARGDASGRSGAGRRLDVACCLCNAGVQLWASGVGDSTALPVLLQPQLRASIPHTLRRCPAAQARGAMAWWMIPMPSNVPSTWPPPPMAWWCLAPRPMGWGGPLPSLPQCGSSPRRARCSSEEGWGGTSGAGRVHAWQW